MPDSSLDSTFRARSDERELTIDFGRLFSLLRRNLGKCVAIALCAFVATLALCATLIPQSFSSQISFSFPQSPQPSMLSMLTGAGGGTGSRYVGVLRSRNFAAQVAKISHVREACGFETEEDAVEAIVKGVNVNDSAKDNLVFVNLSLPGPPRLSLGAGARRKKIMLAASDAANAYSTVLGRYLVTSDTDRESILLRAAGDQLQQAHNEYQKSVRRLGELVVRAPRGFAAAPSSTALPAADSSSSSLGGQDSARTGTGSGMGGSMSSGAIQELQALQLERGRLEADIQSERVAQSTGRGLVMNQLNSLGSLPQEDPLLATARADVNAARTSFDALRVQYGPDHPEVVRAREALKLATQNLTRQTSAISSGVTTEDVSHKVRLNALSERLRVVNQLLEHAQKKAFSGLVFTQQFEQRRNDVALRLEVLKATASQAALLSLQSVSLKNRMAVVDTARPPKSGSPGFAIFVLMGLMISGLVTSVYLVRLGMAPARDGGPPPISVAPEPAAIIQNPNEPSAEIGYAASRTTAVGSDIGSVNR
jgi:uncharacterized protein involved in exopolysaccharide biosynthesis